MTAKRTLERLIAHHFPGAQLQSFSPLAGGVSADVSLLELILADGTPRKLVLRAHGKRHCGLPLVTEFDLLRALASASLPVPEPLDKDESNAILEHPYVLLEYVEGSTEIPSDCVGERIDAMAQQLVAIHQSDTAALPALPPRSDPVPELLGFLGEDAEWDRLRAALRLLGDCPSTSRISLLHGDYWPQNIIWKNNAVAAVIDWEDAGLGDPISDVACACLELSYLYGQEGAAQFSESYQKALPVDPFRFALWQAYVAASGVQSMGNWGLPPERVASMRMVARASIREATTKIIR
ncbi:phosphotransferase family protein [uncultured Erythrobacter sp.]|uniref:phosphotransferase family protein n=1 Tax=uncultured Erythrobacter sp. TaxID=263913 RepID=UPI002605E958|nr:aminoglycoside phosphotransferase family protein [uncultured Erythrobacter sp.]